MFWFGIRPVFLPSCVSEALSHSLLWVCVVTWNAGQTNISAISRVPTCPAGSCLSKKGYCRHQDHGPFSYRFTYGQNVSPSFRLIIRQHQVLVLSLFVALKHCTTCCVLFRIDHTEMSLLLCGAQSGPFFSLISTSHQLE